MNASGEARRVACLAPEIPSLSATFVSGEILELERRGLRVLPISVDAPAEPARDPEARALARRTLQLYPQPLARHLGASARALLRSPGRWLATLARVVSDAARVGAAGRGAPGLLYRFLVAATLAEALRREGCTHLHAHFAHVPTDIAMYASGLSGVPFSFTAHANDLFDNAWLLTQKTARARFAVAISEYNKRFLVARGARPEAVHVVHCGVDARRWAAPERRPPTAVPRIGALGRMVEKKGFEDLVRACALLRDRGRAFALEIVGGGPLEPRVAALLRDRRLEARVALLGARSHDEVVRWLPTLDLFVLACRRDARGDQDGIPVALMEAMAAGVPVVSTRLSGIPELVEDGRSGWLAEPGDPSGLADAIAAALADDAGRAAVRSRALERIRSDFDLPTNAERLAQFF